MDATMAREIPVKLVSILRLAGTTIKRRDDVQIKKPAGFLQQAFCTLQSPIFFSTTSRQSIISLGGLYFRVEE